MKEISIAIALNVDIHIDCDCGERVEMYSENTSTTCECGIEYSSSVGSDTTNHPTIVLKKDDEFLYEEEMIFL